MLVQIVSHYCTLYPVGPSDGIQDSPVPCIIVQSYPVICNRLSPEISNQYPNLSLQHPPPVRRFELVVNGKQVSATSTASAAKPKAPNPFAAFVKENYKECKEPGLKHGDVMKILSAKFSEAKIAK